SNCASFGKAGATLGASVSRGGWLSLFLVDKILVLHIELLRAGGVILSGS
ncbi:MAG: hypothetical protein ACI81A_001821, partial [Paraglaciecola sp.]